MPDDTEVTDTAPAVIAAERTYARTIGWVYFILAVTGLFTDNLWHMFVLTGTMTIIHFVIGIAGLVVAGKGGVRAHRVFGIVMGLGLSAWGVTGTLAPHVLTPYPLPLENALHVLTGMWGFYGVGNAFWQRFKG